MCACGNGPGVWTDVTRQGVTATHVVPHALTLAPGDAYPCTMGIKQVCVGVVDSGWDRRIPHARVLSGAAVVGVRRFAVEIGHDDHDRIGHGTECAAIVLDLAQQCRVRPVRLFDRELQASPEQLVAAIDWAIAMRVQILNLSLATGRKDSMAYLYRACSRARDKGIIIVAAAANAGGASYPAMFEHVIGVAAGALDIQTDYIYREGEAIEVLGNGVLRPGTLPRTSYAAARISGLLARFFAHHPCKDIEEARALLRASASGHLHRTAYSAF